MLFRLHDGSIISADDECLKLSVWFANTIQDVQPPGLIAQAIKNSPFREYRKAIVELFQSDDFVLNEAVIKAMHNQDDPIWRQLHERCENQANAKIMQDALDYLRTHVNDVFESIVHHIKFLRDDMLKLVIEFLSIKCENRSENMLDNLSALVQGCPLTSDLKSVVDPAFHPYLDLIRPIPIDKLLELARAGSLVGLRSLISLVGCALARHISVTSEQDVRKNYSIPEKYRSSVREKLTTILREQEWTKFVPSAQPNIQ